MYIYVSDEQVFDNFSDHSSLFWRAEQIEYGDWTSGPNGDGTYEMSGAIAVSEVGH